jgi:hypothetical protein
LAWRTIHWVCTVDWDACDAIQKESLLDSGILVKAVKDRFPIGNTKIVDAWTRIFETSVPFVTGDAKQTLSTVVDPCSSNGTVIVNGENLLTQLANSILHGVVCGRTDSRITTLHTDIV